MYMYQGNENAKNWGYQGGSLELILCGKTCLRRTRLRYGLSFCRNYSFHALRVCNIVSAPRWWHFLFAKVAHLLLGTPKWAENCSSAAQKSLPRPHVCTL